MDGENPMWHCPTVFPSIGAGLGVEDSWEVEGSSVWGRGRGIEGGTILPCPAHSKPVAGANSELTDPHVIANWVPSWDYKI